jgi:hypothetical protein
MVRLEETIKKLTQEKETEQINTYTPVNTWQLPFLIHKSEGYMRWDGQGKLIDTTAE